MGLRYLKNTVTLTIVPDKCVGCGLCIEVCPHAVFQMTDNRAVIADKDACIECGACAKNCQFNAINVKTGVGCATALINGMLRGTEPACDC